MKNNVMTGAAILVKALEKVGVNTIFGIPGVHNLKIYDALTKSKIEHVTTRNESGAGFMADGYGRVSGKVGTALVITGPGLTNILTPMGQAYHDAIPMVVISSQLPTSILQQSTGYLHELKNTSIMAKSVAKDSITVRDVRQIETVVHSAYALAKAGKPGPVHIDIPLDLLAEKVIVESFASYEESKVTTYIEEPLYKAIELINENEKIAIVAGGGACDASDAVLELVEKLNAPIVQTAAGKGVVSDLHPLCIGTRLPFENVRSFLKEQDLVIAIGTQLAPTDLWEFDLELNGKMIQIDLDADAFTRNYPADIGIKGDAKEILELVLPSLQKKGDDKKRIELVKEIKAITTQNAPLVTGNTKTFDIGIACLNVVEKVLGERGVFVTDMTTAAYIGLSEYNAKAPRTFLHPVGFGTLGYSVPAAIGAKVSEPQKNIIALIGDGGFQFTMQELAVACTLKISLPIIIWNNDGYGEIKRNEKAMGFEKLIAVDNLNPDFIKLASAYGIDGISVTSQSNLEEALTKALKKGEPTIIELHVDRWEK